MKIKEEKLFDANAYEITDDVSAIDEVLEYEQILLSVSKSIINYRKNNNLTQKELADSLNMNQAMISKIEKGTYNPTLKILYTFSRKLTKSSNFFINILKDIISNLYKSKNIKYSMHYQIVETYKSSKPKDNITYLNPNNNNNKEYYGGMVYGSINKSSRLSANG